MFHTLNRLLKLCAVALLAWGGWWLWTQRSHAQPVIDLYYVWQRTGYTQPEDLPRLQGTVISALSENTVLLEDAAGQKYRIALVGLPPIAPGMPGEVRERKAQTSKLSTLVAGKDGAVAYTVLTPQHFGTGFLYLGTNGISFNSEMMAQGLAHLNPQAIRLLPLQEQAYLRGVVRRSGSAIADLRPTGG